jgi:hypothetical protein
MYTVDKDEVVPLPDIPQSSVGSPRPILLADEFAVVLAYWIEHREIGQPGTDAALDDDITEEPTAVVVFEHCTAHLFGPPNDESFSGHPLASRGLEPYGAFEVKKSSWVRALERMNSVHPHHRPERYARLRHFILAFHDSTFECVAPGYKTVTVVEPLHEVIDRMKGMIDRVRHPLS